MVLKTLEAFLLSLLAVGPSLELETAARASGTPLASVNTLITHGITTQAKEIASRASGMLKGTSMTWTGLNFIDQA